jgi:peptidoglycan/xylan/chitin deacetylase (PgdA/CDA1 family)
VSRRKAWRRGIASAAAAAFQLSGLPARQRRRRRRQGDFRVFLLEYHGVDPGDREAEGTISQRRFRRHVRWLAERFELTTVADAAFRLRADRLDHDLVVLTFDDGYLDNVDGAFPVLRELGVPATIYLTTGFLDGQELWFDVARRALAAARGVATKADPAVAARLAATLGAWPPTEDLEKSMRRLKYLAVEARLAAVADLRAAGLELGPAARPMSWDQARQLRDAGIELGAHTVTHPILSRLDPAAQEIEIAGSRDRLAAELGEAPRSFAIPNGSPRDYDVHTLEIVQRLGFVAGCTTRRGSNRPGDSVFELRRLGVGSDSIALLEARLAGLFDENVRRRFGGGHAGLPTSS